MLMAQIYSSLNKVFLLLCLLSLCFSRDVNNSQTEERDMDVGSLKSASQFGSYFTSNDNGTTLADNQTNASPSNITSIPILKLSADKNVLSSRQKYKMNIPMPFSEKYYLLRNSAKWQYNWIELRFKGVCFKMKNKSAITQNMLVRAVSNLLIMNENYVKFNYFSCNTKFKLNVSIEREAFSKREHYLYYIVDNEDISLHLLNMTFRLVSFVTTKSSIFIDKPLQVNKLRIFRLIAYGASAVAILFLATSAILYSCHNSMKQRKKNKVIMSSEFCNAYEESTERYKKENVQRNVYGECSNLIFPNLKTKVNKANFEDLDFEIPSNSFHDNHEAKQQTLNIADVALPDVRTFSNSDTHEHSENPGFSDYYQNFDYSRNDSFSDDSNADLTDHDVNNSQAPITASSESLGLTRIQFLDQESPSFRIETDL